jgi:DNA polymerase elongation subunit (family B)
MKKAIREARFSDAEYLDMKQNSYKLYGNTLYGMLGLKYFQFYNLKCAHSVTSFGVDLIKYTITELSDYIDNKFASDERFKRAFGAYPELDPELKGYGRFSHGDTDSFFIIYDDIFAKYEAMKGKTVDVVVIDGKEVVSRTSYSSKEEAELRFQETMQAQLPDEWNALSPAKQEEFTFQGVYTSKKADKMIVLDRHLLTDFCRILDRIIMQDLLDGIMDAFAAKWQTVDDHKFYLKREKCILGALVSAKKKYLCLVESNEDILYPEPKEAVTGLEIVRSSTPPFARSRLKKLVSSMVRGATKQDVKDMILKYQKEFYEHIDDFNIYDISMPSGTKKNPLEVEEALSTKGVYFTSKSASIWNDLIANDPILNKEGLEPVFAGSKVKQLAVKENNKYATKYIVYNASECPERLLELFEVDWDKQWRNCFYSAASRFTEVCGWGKDILNNDVDDMELFG